MNEYQQELAFARFAKKEQTKKKDNRVSKRGGHEVSDENPLIKYLNDLCKQRVFVLSANGDDVWLKESRDAMSAAKMGRPVKDLNLNALENYFVKGAAFKYLRGPSPAESYAAKIKNAKTHVVTILKALHIDEGSAAWNKALSEEMLDEWQKAVTKKMLDKKAAAQEKHL